MVLKIFNDNGSVKSYEIKKELFFDDNCTNKISYIASSKKEENALNILKSYFSNAKSILFDHTNKLILKQLEELNIKEFNKPFDNKNIFEDKDFSFLYFTSGSTGSPIGALKTQENIISEIEVLSSLLSKYKIKKVIVTVPFIHFYGSLMGIFYPLFNDIDIILKEHFLPNDLLDIIDDYSLIVTTPLYIKSLNRINCSKNLSKSIFISSTAPLLSDDAKEFNKKFSSNILQIFGSTETGGIAYKFNTEELWTPLQKVTINVNKNKELKVSSPFVSQILYENEFKYIHGQLQTFDYIEQHQTQFKLIGRSSQILKIAGKRYSTLQIEDILEKLNGVTKAMVFVNNTQNSESLREESLNITLESSQLYSHKEIKKILQDNLSNLKFSIDLKIVDKIPVSSVGKKLKI